MGDTAIPLPLAGVRVLDLTDVLVGPFRAYLLALMGAEVANRAALTAAEVEIVALRAEGVL